MWESLALIGGQAISSLVNSILGQKTARQNTERTIQGQKELAEYAYSKDLEMWNRQNQYNLPLNQMQRFKDAGLNPNLVFSKGSPGNAQVLPKYNAPTIKYENLPIQVPNLVGTYFDIKTKKANASYLESKANKEEQLAETANLNKHIKAAQLLGKDYVMKLSNFPWIDSTDKNVKYVPWTTSPMFTKQMQELSKTSGQIQLIDTQKRLKEQELELYKLLKGSGALAPWFRMIIGLMR